jgi:ATP-dependent helicase/nuclease subunit B
LSGIAALGYHNRPAAISTADLDAVLSVSQIETFAACPFQHFARYRLRLKPRKLGRVERTDFGTLSHHLLEAHVAGAIARGMPAFGVPEQLAGDLARLAAPVARRVQRDLALSRGQTDRLMRRVIDSAEQTMRWQSEFSLDSPIQPYATELTFGFDGGLPPLVVSTPAGRTVRFRGKIDRLDLFLDDDRALASVVDYKSGGKSLSITQVRLGTMLQLLTYLLAIADAGPQWIRRPVEPVAGLYVRAQRPFESVKDLQAVADPDRIRAEKPGGIFRRDLADRLTTPAMLPVQSRTYVHAEDFNQLMDWTRRRIGQLVDDIADGTIEPRPYLIGTTTPCPNCAMRSVCRFDRNFNRYQIVPLTSSVKDLLKEGRP